MNRELEKRMLKKMLKTVESMLMVNRQQSIEINEQKDLLEKQLEEFGVLQKKTSTISDKRRIELTASLLK